MRTICSNINFLEVELSFSHAETPRTYRTSQNRWERFTLVVNKAPNGHFGHGHFGCNESQECSIVRVRSDESENISHDRFC